MSSDTQDKVQELQSEADKVVSNASEAPKAAKRDVEPQQVPLPAPKKQEAASSSEPQKQGPEVDKSISTYNGAKTDKYNWA